MDVTAPGNGPGGKCLGGAGDGTRYAQVGRKAKCPLIHPHQCHTRKPSPCGPNTSPTTSPSLPCVGKQLGMGEQNYSGTWTLPAQK